MIYIIKGSTTHLDPDGYENYETWIYGYSTNKDNAIKIVDNLNKKIKALNGSEDVFKINLIDDKVIYGDNWHYYYVTVNEVEVE